MCKSLVTDSLIMMEKSSNAFANFSLNISSNIDLYIIFKTYIFWNTISYFLPFAIALSLINNVIIIGIFMKSKRVINNITKTMRIYYIAIAISDINISLPLHLTYFLGKFIKLF